MISEIALSELKVVYLEAELGGLEAETGKADIFRTKQGVQYIQDMRQIVFSCAPLENCHCDEKHMSGFLFKKSV